LNAEPALAFVQTKGRKGQSCYSRSGYITSSTDTHQTIFSFLLFACHHCYEHSVHKEAN